MTDMLSMIMVTRETECRVYETAIFFQLFLKSKNCYKNLKSLLIIF